MPSSITYNLLYLTKSLLSPSNALFSGYCSPLREHQSCQHGSGIAEVWDLLSFFAFSSTSFTGQEGKSRTWQLWIVTWRGCTGTCSGLTRSPSLWSGTPPSGSTFYLKSKLLSFLLLTTSSHHHYHQTWDHQVLMPTSSHFIVLQGDKERHIHWVGGQPGGVDCGELAAAEAACG